MSLEPEDIIEGVYKDPHGDIVRINKVVNTDDGIYIDYTVIENNSGWFNGIPYEGTLSLYSVLSFETGLELLPKYGTPLWLALNNYKGSNNG